MPLKQFATEKRSVGFVLDFTLYSLLPECRACQSTVILRAVCQGVFFLLWQTGTQSLAREGIPVTAILHFLRVPVIQRII
jgi:hypothetical protein